MSQRNFHDHAYLELLKSSRTGESTLACQLLRAHATEQKSGITPPTVLITESRRHVSDSVDFCLSILSELYFENTQAQPSDALIALWRRQILDILFRGN
jgi:hypothetical protein